MRKILFMLIIIVSLLLTSCELGDIKPPSDGMGLGAGDGSDNSGGNDNNGSASGGSDTDADGHKHSDSDANGYCDGCEIYLTTTFDFYAINDMHGKLFDGDTHIGADELTTYLKNQAESDDNAIILSSGDMWQGTYESNLTGGNMMTEWMNEIGCVSMTLGNHEFDWGEEPISSNAELASFPLLAINVYERDTNTLAEYCTPSLLLEFEGFEIGIIGAIGDCYSSISPEKVEGVYFKVGKELTGLVKAQAQRLREAGADFIVYSLHDGLGRSYSDVRNVTASEISSYYDIALSDGYVDLVFEAHTHQSYVLLDRYGVYHLQGGGDNSGISHVEVSYDLLSGESSFTVAETLSSSAYATEQKSELISQLAARYEEEIALGEKYLGTNDSYKSGDALRQKIAELYAKAGEEYFTDYNVVLGGGYLSVRSPGALNVGAVYYKDIYAMFPFDNDLVLCSISGSDLLSRFINTTNSNYFSGYTEYGISVKDNISSSATYYIVTDTYSAYYAPNRLTPIAFYKSGVYARDLLAEYICSGGFGLGANDAVPPGTTTEIKAEDYPMISVSEALTIGAALPLDAVTEEYYYLLVEITAITNETWGNMYVKDKNGDSIYVYGVYDSSGSTKYGYLSERPTAGDMVLLWASIKNYNSQSGSLIELINARMIVFDNEIIVTQSAEIAASCLVATAPKKTTYVCKKSKYLYNIRRTY